MQIRLRPRAVFLAALFLPLFLSAQTGKQVVSIASPQRIAAKRGTSVTEPIQVTVQPGYHVNSNKPRDEFLVPLKLSWSRGPLAPTKVLYPVAQQVRVGDETLDVFTGTFTLNAEFTVPATATPGIAMTQGTLHYQACDNVSCKRPASVTVQVPVSIQ